MIDLLIRPCGQLLTLAGPAAPRRGAGMRDVRETADGALGIDKATGRIAFAGPATQLDRGLLAPECEVIDASACVVMPGFADSHTHLVYAGSRSSEFYQRAAGTSYAAIAQAGGGIASTMHATRAASEAELEELAHGRLHQLYNAGTTAVEIKSGYGLDHEHEIVQLKVIRRLAEAAPGLIASTFMGAHALPEEMGGRREEYLAVMGETLVEAADLGLAGFYDIFIDPLAFGQAEAEAIVLAAAGTGLRLKVHADEFGDDGTAAWAARHGAMSADHLGGVSAAGIRALANSRTIATLLPTTMFYTGHEGYAPARALIDAGCAVALATDHNPGSSVVYGMQFVLTLAALKMRMSAEECIVASTINGAHAMGAGHETGSLEAGKRADFIVVDLPDYRELPCHIGGDFVRDVFIAGQPVKRMGYLAAQP